MAMGWSYRTCFGFFPFLLASLLLVGAIGDYGDHYGEYREYGYASSSTPNPLDLLLVGENGDIFGDHYLVTPEDYVVHYDEYRKYGYTSASKTNTAWKMVISIAFFLFWLTF